LPKFEEPAFQTPVGAGLPLWFRGDPAVALRVLPGAISRPPDAISYILVRALRDLRQPRIAAHRCRARAGRNCDFRTDPRASGAALRTVPAQVFFRATVAKAKAARGGGEGQLGRAAHRAFRVYLHAICSHAKIIFYLKGNGDIV
jgi:hypothetical protein